MAGYRPLFECQKLLNSAVSLTALGPQFVTSLLMASLHQEKASWNEKEVEALVNYLWEHRAESGDGGTFKDVTFNAIPGCIADLLTSGPAKTAKQCKTKYNSLKATFRTIITYKDTTSGTHWDGQKGANIEGDAAVSAWNNYINASKLISPFRNKGWPYFENFQDIIPNASARGANAFSAMQTAPPAPLNETLDLGEGTIDEMSTNNSTGNTLINPMDIDWHESDTTSTFTSNSFGKRKLDVITFIYSSFTSYKSP
ncbi:hypothetical protein BYT27DRAFT_7171949 [Phlegmacium glaucopus]|nr:hypothetical protein BYT27DRAFT_7171949 [Phlegmacium glaucopus]